MRSRIHAIATALLVCAAPSFAQTPDSAASVCSDQIDLSSSLLSDARRSLERTIALTTGVQQSGMLRARSMPVASCIATLPFLRKWDRGNTGDAISMQPLEVAEFGNTAYPRSVNDGAAWNGVGVNFGVTTGIQAQWRFLTASIAPELYHQQNGDFRRLPNTMPGMSPYNDPYRDNIDYPSRFGNASFTTFAPGQSFVRADLGPVGITAGTENVWIGAAEVHPILMSYTAPGVPHVRIGTQKPIDVWFANLEVHMLFASVSESDYFDDDASNDDHFFGTTMAVLEPKFVPGLFLGFARSYHDPDPVSGQDVSFFLSRIIETPFGNLAGGNRPGNAIGVMFGRWVHPASGFEAYAEWGREDTPGGWIDVLREPDWTQAYVLGVQKAFKSTNRLTRLYAELTHLGESAPARAGRGFFSYYTHNRVRQGHTNDGQILGAAIGPGSDAQMVGVDVFSASGRSAFRIERTRYDDDTYYRTFARRFGETRHDAEITLSASRMQFIGTLEVEAGLSFSRRYGRQFLTLATGEANDIAESNWGTRLTAAWPLPF